METLFVVQEGAIAGVTTWFWVLWFMVAWFLWSIIAAVAEPKEELEVTLMIGAMIACGMTALGLIGYGALLVSWAAFLAYALMVIMVLVVSAIRVRAR